MLANTTVISRPDPVDNMSMNEDWYGKEPDSFFTKKVEPVLAVAFACIPAASILYGLFYHWLKSR